MHLVIVFKGKGGYLGLTMPTKRGCKAVLMFFLEILWIAYFTFVVLERHHMKEHSSLVYNLLVVKMFIFGWSVDQIFKFISLSD